MPVGRTRVTEQGGEGGLVFGKLRLYYLWFGKNQASFKLTNQLPNPSGLVLGPSPTNPFLDLLGFCVPHPMQPFPRARLHPFVPTAQPHSRSAFPYTI